MTAQLTRIGAVFLPSNMTSMRFSDGGDTHRGDLTAVRAPVTVDGGNDHVVAPVPTELGFELAERPQGRVAAATGILIDATARIEMQRG